MTATTDNSGQLKSETVYDAFGNIVSRSGTSANKFGYTGHQMDQETGLIYFQARYYDPQTGRFITQDPYEGDWNTPLSLHHYLYAYGNPTTYVDLHGYSPQDPNDNWNITSRNPVTAIAPIPVCLPPVCTIAPMPIVTPGGSNGGSIGGAITRGWDNLTSNIKSISNKIFGDAPASVSGASASARPKPAEYRISPEEMARWQEDWAKKDAQSAGLKKATTPFVITEGDQGKLEGKPIEPIKGPSHTGQTKPRPQSRPILEGKPIHRPDISPLITPIDQQEGNGIIGTPIAEQDFKSHIIAKDRRIANQVSGSDREKRVQGKLEAAFPNADVQRERLLRNADNTKAVDPVTGEGRRIDHAVIENGVVIYLIETTSKTSDKAAQTEKEINIRSEGGTFIRDKRTGKLIDVSNVPTRIIRVK
ncbi:hypothetical protein H8K55_21210 [Undibacterium sp. LX15W]|uniref:Teneurin-like YD-shell domain-containing protein n=1 Tax=Undibacterium flavidum TaxID=2762297 RepID=A0ABR6YHQ0_9BURK|nr:hypothetical protein [Undibacterium flavidum]